MAAAGAERHLPRARVPAALAGQPGPVGAIEALYRSAQLALRELRRAGVACEASRVDTEASLRAALAAAAPDLILSDFSFPGAFDGTAALAVARSLAPETPFVFISGTIGEERAIDAVPRFGLCARTDAWRVLPRRTLPGECQPGIAACILQKCHASGRQRQHRIGIARLAAPLWGTKAGRLTFSREPSRPARTGAD